MISSFCTFGSFSSETFFPVYLILTAHKRPNEQNLFGIVQGGLDPVLR